MTLNDYTIYDIVYHITPSGIRFIGVVRKIDFKLDSLDIAWFSVPGGSYFADAPAHPDRVEWIGRMPEGAYWDGNV